MKKRTFAFIILFACIIFIIGISIPGNESPEFTVGICQFTQHESLDAATQGFMDALTDKLGYKVAFEERNANGDFTMCTTIINDLVSKDVDLILANSTDALQAAANATSQIPILGTAVTEYGTALQLSDFNGTTGINISGTSDLVSPQAQAAMIQELFPDVKKVGMIYCSSEPNSQYQVDALQEQLSAMGYSCESYLFVDSGSLSSVTEAAASACDVLYIPTDNTVASNAELIANICLPAGIPVIAGEENTCRICGAVTLSIDYYDLGYDTGEMAAQILLDGKNISDMPVQYAANLTPKYNKAICSLLDIQVPEVYVALESE